MATKKRPSLADSGLFDDTRPRGAEPEAEAPEAGEAMPAAVEEQLRHSTGKGRKRTNFREITKSTQKGLPEGWDRKTFILSEDNIARIDHYAYRNHRKIKVAVNEILNTFFAEHPVKAVPADEILKWKGKGD